MLAITGLSTANYHYVGLLYLKLLALKTPSQFVLINALNIFFFFQTDSAEDPTDSAARRTDSAARPTDSAARPTDSAPRPTDSAPRPMDSAPRPTENQILSDPFISDLRMKIATLTEKKAEIQEKARCRCCKPFWL